MQQLETNKFLLQISSLSQSILAKLEYQRNFLLLPHQIKVKCDEKAKHEIAINKNKFTIDPVQEKPFKIKKKSDLQKSKSQSNIASSNWLDMNDEITQTLEKFDLMLNEYEIDTEQKENRFMSKSYQQLNKSTSLLTNTTSIFSLVNNNNNKCDNTLKKRNALVTFEFKTLLDRVGSQGDNSDEEKLNNEIGNIFPATDYNQFHLNLTSSSQNQSPPSLSSSSSSSSANQSTSSASSSSSSQQICFRTISPTIAQTSKNIHHHKQHVGSRSQCSTLDYPEYNTNKKNVSIWREDLNSKQNIEQKIQKQTEFTRKIEESKRFIPEWKKNLIRQKEMKKKSSNSQFNNVKIWKKFNFFHSNSFEIWIHLNRMQQPDLPMNRPHPNLWNIICLLKKASPHIYEPLIMTTFSIWSSNLGDWI